MDWAFPIIYIKRSLYHSKPDCKNTWWKCCSRSITPCPLVGNACLMAPMKARQASVLPHSRLRTNGLFAVLGVGSFYRIDRPGLVMLKSLSGKIQLTVLFCELYSCRHCRLYPYKMGLSLFNSFDHNMSGGSLTSWKSKFNGWMGEERGG